VQAGAGLDDLDAERLELGSGGTDRDEADRVVTRIRVADADDADPGHTRWMSRLRKWVAHEMHGS
jgi:hypothetical protein